MSKDDVQRVPEVLIGGVDIKNIGFSDFSFGTLGCVVKRGNQYFGLTAAHVLIKPISPNSEIGNISEYVGFAGQDLSNEYAGRINSPRQRGFEIGKVQKYEYNFALAPFDLGIFLLSQTGINTEKHIISFEGRITRILSDEEITINMKVKKYGSNTQVTYGIINDKQGHRIIIAKDPDLHSDEPSPLSESGDSGALWVLNNSDPFITVVGIHIEGDGISAFANPIKEPFTNLNLELL